MRYIIGLLVTAVHLAVLLLALRSCSPQDGMPGREGFDGSDGDRRVENGRVLEKGNNRNAASGADDTRLIPDSYADAPLDLPPKVAAAADRCNTGIMLELEPIRILWRRNADRPVPVASLTKMMTALLLMEKITADSAITLETPVEITKEAYAVGGSQVYLDPREVFTLDELLKCMMIHSANDAAYMIAQFIGGTAEEFVQDMNRRARQLTMKHARFFNPHGLPVSGQKAENTATALEMAYLAGRLLTYPQVVQWSSTWADSIEKDDGRLRKLARRALVNRNALVNPNHGVAGVNGMKTGYTADAGYCVAATCQRNDRALSVVVTGCPSSSERNRLVAGLIAAAFGDAAGEGAL